VEARLVRQVLQELIELVGVLKDRGVEFVSLRESLDTTTPGGKLVFHVFGAVAEFERDLILERTLARLEVAKARGPRPPWQTALFRETVPNYGYREGARARIATA
jgi:DNA invertase Pin-like site-specific DNA recombinase